MARGYSAQVAQNQTPADHPAQSLPLLWLLTDVRNDAMLEPALKRLPRGSALVFRHYHLDAAPRRKRFDQLAYLARKHDHRIILSDSPAKARQWGAEGVYGPAARMPRGNELLKITTAHDWKQIIAAARAGADAIMLSPVFATASHPGAPALGTVRFRMLARKTDIPIIALGGMTRDKARRMGWPRWAAIDGLA